jgi:hypothetical protein
MYGDKPTNQAVYFNFVVLGFFFPKNLAKLVKIFTRKTIFFPI